jgi:hypothetical protein
VRSSLQHFSQQQSQLFQAALTRTRPEQTSHCVQGALLQAPLSGSSFCAREKLPTSHHDVRCCGREDLRGLYKSGCRYVISERLPSILCSSPGV